MTALWLTWERQRRNRSMAKRVGASLHELEYRGGTLTRYAVLSWRSIGIIRRERPKVIYFQNPSIVLCFLISTLKFLGLVRARTVGDFHNAGVHPPVAGFLVPWMVRTNDLTIVSNDNLRQVIEKMGGQAMAIPDPLPEMHATDRTPTQGFFDVFFVCSWASDEPIVEVMRAATLLEKSHPDVRIAISGRPKLERVGWQGPVPSNVELTGFLSEADFDARLGSCHAILDLTTRDDCMVCGAYEATSVGVPMILSDNPPTRGYFDGGALFTDNSAADIARQIACMRQQHDALKAAVASLRDRLQKREAQAFAHLSAAIDQR